MFFDAISFWFLWMATLFMMAFCPTAIYRRSVTDGLCFAIALVRYAALPGLLGALLAIPLAQEVLKSLGR